MKELMIKEATREVYKRCIASYKYKWYDSDYRALRAQKFANI